MLGPCKPCCQDFVHSVVDYFDFVIPSAFFLARGICFFGGDQLRLSSKWPTTRPHPARP
jgi:hypothetical protein